MVIRFGKVMFCFEPDTLMLRYANPNLAEDINYDNIVPFQGRYVARDITISRSGGKLFLKVHVDELGDIARIADAFFSPPPDSKGPLGGRISAPSATFVDEYRILNATPVYPRHSDGKVTDGKVTVNYVIGKDGRIIEATAQEGPEELRNAALEAVRKYRFRPYLILDQPVEVECSESFEFHSK